MKLKNNQKLIENTFILISGNIVAKFLALINSIFIIRLLTVYEYALVKISFILPNILIIIGEFGLNYASIHFISKMNKNQDIRGIKAVIRINLFFKILIGGLFLLLIYLNADFIATNFFRLRENNLIFLIELSSIGIFASILCEAEFSILLGFEKMKQYRFGTIFRILIRTISSLLLIIFGFSLFGPMFGFIFANLIAFIINIILIKKSVGKKNNENHIGYKSVFSQMIKYGYPLTISSMILGFQIPLFEYLLTITSNTSELSYFNVAITSSALILILTHSLEFTFFPAFSKNDWKNKNERPKLIKDFNFSLKLSGFLVLPITFLLIVFTENIFPLIYGYDYMEASLFISLYFLIFIFCPFGSLSIPAFLKGQKRTKEALYIDLLNLLSSIGLSLLFLFIFGGIGVVLGILSGYILSNIYANYIIIRHYGKLLIKTLKRNINIFIIAFLSAVLIFFTKNFTLNLIPGIGFFLKILIIFMFFIIYLILFLFLIGITLQITDSDLETLIGMFKKKGNFFKIIKFFVDFEKNVINLRRRKN